MKRIVPLLLAGCLLAPAAAQAQLRPYDPIAWEMYSGETTLSARAGVRGLFGQRIALLGTRGRVVESGAFRAAWRSGPIVLEAAGVPWRTYHEQERFAPPQAEVEPSPDDNRTDSGDYLVATTVRLTSADTPLIAALRFGTRLPTTNNRVGLERDQTDFFAMAGARWRSDEVYLAGELGVGLHGTRRPDFEQSDVLTYALEAALYDVPLAPTFSVVGHADALVDRSIRGNEELAEARLSLRTGGANWLELQLARGLTSYSPASSITLSVGVTR